MKKLTRLWSVFLDAKEKQMGLQEYIVLIFMKVFCFAYLIIFFYAALLAVLILLQTVIDYSEQSEAAEKAECSV